QQEHRRWCAVELFVAQRNLRIESIVRLMRGERRTGEALVAAERSQVVGIGSRGHRVVASASGKARRGVRRQQRGVVLRDGLIAKVELQVAVALIAAELVAQFRYERRAVGIAADRL